MRPKEKPQGRCTGWQREGPGTGRAEIGHRGSAQGPERTGEQEGAVDTGDPEVGARAQGEKASGPGGCEVVGAVSLRVPGRGSRQDDAPKEKEEKERHRLSRPVRGGAAELRLRGRRGGAGARVLQGQRCGRRAGLRRALSCAWRRRCGFQPGSSHGVSCWVCAASPGVTGQASHGVAPCTESRPAALSHVSVAQNRPEPRCPRSPVLCLPRARLQPGLHPVWSDGPEPLLGLWRGERGRPDPSRLAWRGEDGCHHSGGDGAWGSARRTLTDLHPGACSSSLCTPPPPPPIGVDGAALKGSTFLPDNQRGQNPGSRR